MLRRCLRILAGTNRYTDGSGRELDGSSLPKELYLEPISEPQKYPVRGGHWQPVVAGAVSPFKGNIVIAGGGIVGCVAACMFGLRGWHVTVIEKNSRPSPQGSFVEMALITKRAMDCLHVAGVRVPEVKLISKKVVGMMEHPGSMNTILTMGLTERTQFPVNMLAVDINQLRCVLANHILKLPSNNAKVFYDHAVVAAFADRKTLVVKPLRENERETPIPAMTWDQFVKTKELTTETTKWEDNVEGVDYDFLMAADGVNSKMRSLLQMGETHYTQYALKWCSIKNSSLDASHLHQWHHRFTQCDDSECNIAFVQAFPRLEDGCFSIMFYFPKEVLKSASIEELLKKYCPDLDGDLDVDVSKITSYPTVFSSTLMNSEAFPNTILVGDAAHACNPFLNQNISLALEDVSNALNQIDTNARNKTQWELMRQYSRERGVAGDALRVVTERSMFYARRKHWNPMIRIRNTYQHLMHFACPRWINEWYETSANHVYARSMDSMLNGRGYTTYDLADWQQYRANRWWCFGRLYT